MTPEPNTDRAWVAIERAIDLPVWKQMGWEHDRSDLLDMLDSLLSDAGLWIGQPGDVPPWMTEAPEDRGTHRHDHYCHGVFGCTKSPLYVVTPPEENDGEATPS